MPQEPLGGQEVFYGTLRSHNSDQRKFVGVWRSSALAVEPHVATSCLEQSRKQE